MAALDNIETGKATRNSLFDWYRVLFAVLVMASHSLVLKTGNEADWLARWIGQETFGSVGVKGFFVLSGYFVIPGLLADTTSCYRYIMARVFRIFPGLLCAVLFCIVLGSVLSTLTLPEYFKSNEVLQYLFFNGIGIEPRFSLPGVFSNNPWPNSVNGSLWTLPMEIRCYLMLLLIWWLGFLREKHVAGLALLAIYIAGVTGSGWVAQLFGNPNAGPYIACFALGAAFRIYQWDSKLTLATIALTGLLTILLWSGQLHNLIFPICLAVIIFGINHLRSIGKNLPHLPEDISYGLYLYAYPVQQLIIHLRKDWSLSQQFITSLLIVIILAYLSRILIERPALRFKESLIARKKNDEKV